MDINTIKKCINNALKDTKSLYINDIIEKTKVGYNLTYYMYGSTTDSNFILFTKITFLLDNSKKELKENKIIILYDLNCNYYVTEFKDEVELTKYIYNLFKEGYDKGDIRDISNFLVEGSDNFNKELKKLNKSSIITNIEYVYDKKLTNCNTMSYDFILTDNTEKENKIYLKKHNKNWILNYSEFKNEITQLNDVYKLVAEKLY